MSCVPTSDQQEALDWLERAPRRVAFCHGHGTGATTLEALAAWQCAHDEDGVVLFVAATKATEETFWLALGSLFGPRLNPSRQFLQIPGRGKICGMTGRSIEAWQGLNIEPRRPVLIILSEASAMPEEFIDLLDQVNAATATKVLMTGLPWRKYIPDTDPPEPTFFYRAFSVDKDLWHGVSTSPAVCPWISQQWIDDVRKRHGAESDVFRSRVMGEFPA